MEELQHVPNQRDRLILSNGIFFIRIQNFIIFERRYFQRWETDFLAKGHPNSICVFHGRNNCFCRCKTHFDLMLVKFGFPTYQPEAIFRAGSASNDVSHRIFRHTTYEIFGLFQTASYPDSLFTNERF